MDRLAVNDRSPPEAKIALFRTLLREGKTEVRVYDYADLNVPMRARMFGALGTVAGHEVPGTHVAYDVLLAAFPFARAAE